jgi:hypothetical protein
MFFLGVSGEQDKRVSGQDYIRPPPGAPNQALHRTLDSAGERQR